MRCAPPQEDAQPRRTPPNKETKVTWRAELSSTFASSGCSDFCGPEVNAPNWPCTYVCNPWSSDQLGSQLISILGVVERAADQGCMYIHHGLGSGDGTMRSPGLRKEAEMLIGLKRDCFLKKAPHRNYSSQDPALVGKARAAVWGPGGCITARNNSVSRAINHLSKVADRLRGGGFALTARERRTRSLGALINLRRRFGGNNLSTPWFDGDANVLHVAVHVRRGDLATHTKVVYSVLARWVPDAYYERYLPRIAAAIWRNGSGVRSIWHIMSEGRRSWEPVMPVWERKLLGAGADAVRWHLDDEIITTLVHLSEADVLVQSPSRFSAVAASYSMGVLIGVPFSPYGVGRDLRLEMPVAPCIRPIHLLPISPACSCLAKNAEAYLKERGFRRVDTMETFNATLLLKRLSHRQRSEVSRAEVSLRIGDVLHQEAALTAYGCNITCRPWPTLEDEMSAQPKVPTDHTRLCKDVFERPAALVLFADATFSADIDDLRAWKYGLSGDATESERWQAAWSHVMSMERWLRKPK